MKRRGLVVLMSDLFDDQDAAPRALRHFRHKRHEVVVFHVLDANERSFDFPREALFRDLETQDEMLVRPWELRGEYRKAIGEWIERYRRGCGRSAWTTCP